MAWSPGWIFGYVPSVAEWLAAFAAKLDVAGNALVSAVTLGTGGPTVRAGNGAPTDAQPSGSLWLRQDGDAATGLYLSLGGGVWTPMLAAALPSTPVIGAATAVVTAGTPVTVFPANSIVQQGQITNPPDAPGILYVDPTGAAPAAGSGSTFAIMQGQSYLVPLRTTTAVKAVSAYSGHAFTAVRF